MCQRRLGFNLDMQPSLTRAIQRSRTLTQGMNTPIKPILAGVVIALCVLALFVAAPFVERTRYTQGFTKEAFQAILPGASVGDVVQKLGPPIRNLLASAHPYSYPVPGDASVFLIDVTEIEPWTSDPHYFVDMEYSEPASIGWSYSLYRIRVQDRMVTRASVGRMDD
jgi:hypothetical protein